MGWFDGFPFKSKAQQDKERKAFEKTVFPFGVEEHREAARKVLHEVLQANKLQDDQRLYAYIIAKEAYMECEDVGEEANAALRVLHKQPWVTDEHAALIISLIRLEKGAESLENFPTAEQVREGKPVIE